jgi:hypothetical protein
MFSSLHSIAESIALVAGGGAITIGLSMMGEWLGFTEHREPGRHRGTGRASHFRRGRLAFA